MRRSGLAVLVLALALGCTASASAATFMVTSTADAVDAAPGNGVCASASNGCTLRAAVQEANALGGADEVDLPQGAYEFAIAGRTEDAAATGDLDVTDDLTVAGPDPATTTINAKALDRIFDLRSGKLTITGLRLTGGKASGAGDDTGGAVRTAVGTTLNIAHVNAYSSATTRGNILSNAGVAEVKASRIESPITTNVSVNSVASTGTLLLENVTASGGTVGSFGGTLTVRNSTLLGNTSQGDSTTTRSALENSGGTLTLQNTLLGRTGTGAPPVCTGALPTSLGHNMAGDASCGLSGPGDQNSVDLGLRPASSDGTYFPLWAYGTSFDPAPDSQCDPSLCPRLSRAVDAGDAGACPQTDQIGTPRPQGPGCDIGAIEARQADLAVSAAASAQSIVAGGRVTITWTFTNLGQSGVDSLTVVPTWQLSAPNLPDIKVVDGDLAPANDGCRTGGGAICILKTPLAAGESMTRSLTFEIETAGTRTIKVELNAEYTSDYPPRDPSTANNTVSTAVDVTAPPPTGTESPTQATSTPGACARLKVGNRRANVLRGTRFGDRIRGLGGNDKIYGLAGDDCLDGGAGNDTIVGGRGRDTLVGGLGKDKIDAADGKRDVVDCGPGRDRAVVDKIDRVKRCEKVTRRR